MRSAFAQDIHRIVGIKNRLTLRGAVTAILLSYGLQALLWYRLGRLLIRSRWTIYLWPLQPPGWVLYYFGSRLVRILYDIRLHLNSDVGPGLFIGHFGGIVLDGCKLGSYCSISQSSRIGRGETGVGPLLGDRVWIGAHAQIIGQFTIGTGSTISAAAVVKRDVPEATLCMGNPARIVMRDYDNTVILMLT